LSFLAGTITEIGTVPTRSGSLPVRVRGGEPFLGRLRNDDGVVDLAVLVGRAGREHHRCRAGS